MLVRAIGYGIDTVDSLYSGTYIKAKRSSVGTRTVLVRLDPYLYCTDTILYHLLGHCILHTFEDMDFPTVRYGTWMG